MLCSSGNRLFAMFSNFALSLGDTQYQTCSSTKYLGQSAELISVNLDADDHGYKTDLIGLELQFEFEVAKTKMRLHFS